MKETRYPGFTGGQWMISGKHDMTDQEWDESIERGLKDIKEGRVREIKTSKDLYKHVFD